MEILNCPNCGMSNVIGSRSCSKCGAAIGQQVFQQPDQPVQSPRGTSQSPLSKSHPGESEMDTMLIVVLSIVAGVIVILPVILMSGPGGFEPMTLEVQNVNDSRVTFIDWNTSGNKTVPVTVMVHNNGSSESTGTIHVEIDTTYTLFYTSIHTAEANKGVSIGAGLNGNVTVYVMISGLQANHTILGETTTIATIS